MKAELSKKDEKFLAFSLGAPVWKVVLRVSLPLALYQSLNQLFKILDSMMAAHISLSYTARGREAICQRSLICLKSI